MYMHIGGRRQRRGSKYFESSSLRFQSPTGRFEGQKGWNIATTKRTEYGQFADAQANCQLLSMTGDATTRTVTKEFVSTESAHVIDPLASAVSGLRKAASHDATVHILRRVSGRTAAGAGGSMGS